MKRCQNCGSEIKADAKFCPKCGCQVKEPILLFCKRCGHKQLSLLEKFCPCCGTPYGIGNGYLNAFFASYKMAKSKKHHRIYAIITIMFITFAVWGWRTGIITNLINDNPIATLSDRDSLMFPDRKAIETTIENKLEKVRTPTELFKEKVQNKEILWRAIYYHKNYDGLTGECTYSTMYNALLYFYPISETHGKVNYVNYWVDREAFDERGTNQGTYTITDGVLTINANRGITMTFQIDEDGEDYVRLIRDDVRNQMIFTEVGVFVKDPLESGLTKHYLP